jgi:monoamine oxidase
MTEITPAAIRAVAAAGLPQAAEPQHVVVVGAGMAGLVAADRLLRAGHHVTLLEARARVGGRVHTLREPFSDGLHAEAGAMRIPRNHDLTLHYVERFGLPTAPFTMNNPKAWVRLHGRQVRAEEFRTPEHAAEFELDPREAASAVGDLWAATLAPILGRIRSEGEAGWSAVAAELDQYTLREFLEVRGWSHGAIELFGLCFQMESLMNSAFLELLREEAGEWFTNVVYIEGGMDRLPRSFLPELGHHIRFGARLTAISQHSDGADVHYQNAAGRGTMHADRVIVTLPFSVLRHVEMTPALSRGKQRAIRQLHYDASAKILLQFRRRFWEDDDGIYGGGTATDLPVRAVYYPDHGRETGRGVVLGSYTWAEDAQRWGSLPPADRVAQALENIELIHPGSSKQFEVGTSVMWHDDEFAGGAFAMFDAGQQTYLYKDVIAAEGRIHFAGEHASFAHAWIQGAIESGLRAAIEVAERG